MRSSFIIIGTLVVLAASATGAEEQSTSLWDMIPVIAQGKSLVQIIFGDKEGAKKTQENFLNEGLGTSQLRSAYFLVTGEPRIALDIQEKFFSNLEVVIDSIPLLGHLKGGIHMITGDSDHGWQAMKSATSSTGVIIGGILSGPAAAIGAHVLTDALISGVDRIVNGNQSQPHGIVRYGLNIQNMKPGEHFDELAGLVLDVTVGKNVVKNKRGKSNTPHRYGVDGTADSHELKLLIEKDDVETPVEPPKRANTETEKNEPHPLKITRGYYRLPPGAYDEANELKRNAFRRFLLGNGAYKGISFDEYWSHHKPDGVDDLQYNQYLNLLDIDALKSKLGYLTEDEKSLISKDDFRTVNVNNLNTNCLQCSIAGIMNLDLETVQRYIKENLETYDPNSPTETSTILNSLQKGKRIRYESSRKLDGISELRTYLRSNALRLENKHIILEKLKMDENYSPPMLTGHAVVLKFKMAKPNYPDPVMLVIDYQLPAFVRESKPNPMRFQTFMDLNNFNNFVVNEIELRKSHLN